MVALIVADPMDKVIPISTSYALRDQLPAPGSSWSVREDTTTFRDGYRESSQR